MHARACVRAVLHHAMLCPLSSVKSFFGFSLLLPLLVFSSFFPSFLQAYSLLLGVRCYTVTPVLVKNVVVFSSSCLQPKKLGCQRSCSWQHVLSLRIQEGATL